MHSKIRKIAYIALGCLSLTVGIIGWILPIMHGTLFVVVGLLMLTTHSETVRKWTDRFMARHPQIKGHYELWKGKVHEYRRRWF